MLLLPIQLSVLHVPSPAVTPTNLLFNVAAVPGWALGAFLGAGGFAGSYLGACLRAARGSLAARPPA